MNYWLSKVAGDSLGMRTLGRFPEPGAALHDASSTCRRAQEGSLRFDKCSNVVPLHCQTSAAGRNPPPQRSPVCTYCTTKSSPILLGVNHLNVRNVLALMARGAGVVAKQADINPIGHGWRALR